MEGTHPEALEWIRFIDRDARAGPEAGCGIGQLVPQPLEVQVVGNHLLQPVRGKVKEKKLKRKKRNYLSQGINLVIQLCRCTRSFRCYRGTIIFHFKQNLLWKITLYWLELFNRINNFLMVFLFLTLRKLLRDDNFIALMISWFIREYFTNYVIVCVLWWLRTYCWWLVWAVTLCVRWGWRWAASTAPCRCRSHTDLHDKKTQADFSMTLSSRINI